MLSLFQFSYSAPWKSPFVSRAFPSSACGDELAYNTLYGRETKFCLFLLRCCLLRKLAVRCIIGELSPARMGDAPSALASLQIRMARGQFKQLLATI